MSKVIIGIHGIGNKPTKNLLKEWWEKSIYEGLNKLNFPKQNFDFELVYWADILNKEPILPDETNNKNSLFQKEKYAAEQNLFTNEIPGLRKKAVDYLEKYYEKIIVNGVMSLEYPTITDLFVHYNLKELEAYFSQVDFYYQGEKRLIKEVMMERLTNVLKKHKHKQILLIAHSMGSMISHDALIDKLDGISIDTLVTLGSPLGQKYVMKKIETEHNHNFHNRLKVPENIKKNWYNLSDQEDPIALVHTLSDIYKSNLNGVKVIDKLVKNNYSNLGDRNPHKSYGYLRTSEVAEILSNFITVEKRSIFSFFKKRF
ncbi:MAG: lipase family protein [Ignavibacteriaceae bacterium]|jgi:hypothetical protein|nr:lipase family protein [Ignavibacteriaceae bacterium]